MRWLPVLVVLAAGGCGVFSSEDSPATPPGPDAGGIDGDAGADSAMSVGGPAAPLFALGPVTTTTAIVHGTTAKVSISITRELGFMDPVQITTKNLRDGITSAPLSITTDRGDLEISVPAAAAQGAADGVIEATAGGVTRTTPVSLLVGGKPGEIDTTYGANGYVTGIFGKSVNFVDAKLAADDSVFVVATDSGAGSASVAHVHADGTLDKTYGTSGVATVGVYAPHTAAVQPDGKLVVVGGDLSHGTYVGRLDSAGHADTTFGQASNGPGTTILPAPGVGGVSAGSFGVVVRPDGDIIVGFDNPVSAPMPADRVGVARLAPDGSLRTTFGTTGTARYANGDLLGVTVRDAPGTASNGSIVVVWADTTPSPHVLGFFQANGDTGGTDTTFGAAIKTVPIDGTSRPVAQRGAGLVTLSDQSIVAATTGASSFSFYLRKYDPKGDGVSSFGVAGLAGPFSAGTNALAPLSIAAQADGKLLIAVAALTAALQPAGMDAVRFTATGTIDTAFGQSGHVADTVGYASVVLVQKSGRIVLIGEGASPGHDALIGGYWP